MMITILVPAYNEADTLPVLVRQLDKMLSDSGLKDRYEFEYLFVNDGSKDATFEVILALRQQFPEISYVDLSRNFGKENAMLAGFDYAQGDAVIIMDADLQDPVDVIPEMIGYWEEGYEDVYGKRATRGHESWLRKKLSLTYYHLLQRATRIDILQNVGDFRLLDRKCVNALKELRETQRYTKGLYCWIGFKKKEFTFDRGDRVAGRTSFNMRGLFNLAVEGVLCFTTMPLRMASIVGLAVALIAFIYLAVIIGKTLIFGEVVQGFPTIICTILFMGGVQLMALGIIGEYVGRIFNETKHRPPYIVSAASGNSRNELHASDKAM
jgi:glycosyltransferase involved in cell wall biosynthesis